MIKLNSIFGICILALLIAACSSESNTNFTLKVNIKGLKKGVVYLQKKGDSTLINLDSLAIKGQSEFKLHTNLEEPVLLYLRLSKNDNKEHYIPFFADKGVTEITTSLKYFNFDSKIKGSKQQDLLDNYLKVMRRFRDENLNLITANFLAQKNNDSIAIDSISKSSERLTKRKYSYAIQFAINNADSEIAPYIALHEIPEANPIYLDSIYNELTAPVKNSLYGNQLKAFITEIKTKLQ